MRRVAFIVSLLIVALVAGCAKRYRLQREDFGSPSPWPFHHGSAAGQGLTVPASFDGELSLIWKHKVAGKPAGPLTIYDNSLLFPSVRKKLRVYSLVDGKYQGKVKARGPVQTGVTVADSLGFAGVSQKNAELRAFNLFNRKMVWHRPIKDVCPGSIIVNNVLIVSFTDGLILGLDYRTGETVWEYQADQRLVAAPVVSGDTLFQPGDHGRLYLLSASSGTELGRFDHNGTTVASVTIGQAIYLTDLAGRVMALDRTNGAIIWQAQLDGPLWTSGALGHDQLVVAHSGGEVVALDLVDGSTRWRFDAESAVKASPIIVGQYVVVGTATGRVYSLDLRTGQETSRFEIKGSVDFSPVTDGRRVYVATDEGRIVCLGKQDKYAETSR
jgi:outer membrane protein assembly factor BamB